MAWPVLVMGITVELATGNGVLFFTIKCGVPMGIHKSFQFAV